MHPSPAQLGHTTHGRPSLARFVRPSCAGLGPCLCRINFEISGEGLMCFEHSVHTLVRVRCGRFERTIGRLMQLCNHVTTFTDDYDWVWGRSWLCTGTAQAQRSWVAPSMEGWDVLFKRTSCGEHAILEIKLSKVVGGVFLFCGI